LSANIVLSVGDLDVESCKTTAEDEAFIKAAEAERMKK